jgi:hypothetical protein
VCAPETKFHPTHTKFQALPVPDFNLSKKGTGIFYWWMIPFVERRKPTVSTSIASAANLNVNIGN